MVKVRPSKPSQQASSAARKPGLYPSPNCRWGDLKRKGFYVGRSLTIPQLPLGGLKNGPQICEVSLKRRLHIFPKRGKQSQIRRLLYCSGVNFDPGTLIREALDLLIEKYYHPVAKWPDICKASSTS